ncbi:MAG: DUF481 domain-containing protein [Candidatus Latescibacterota bacterium]|nr:MAG: DUF481 domain-containing protein [Candidatus Latescibacterota bacterium]
MPLITLVGWILIIGSTGNAHARPKTDIVILSNGDRITCEIKELTRDKLRVKTDSAGTIEIEWEDIVSIKSDYYFRVEDAAGHRYFGEIELIADKTLFRIASQSEIVTLERDVVTEIVPIETSFWSRFDGSIKFGYDFTRASNVAKGYVDWKNYYSTERNMVDSKVYFGRTDRHDDQGIIIRNEISLVYTRLLRGKWTGSTGITFERNDELDLQRRILISIANGTTPLKSNRHRLLASLGLSLNSELATDSTETTESLEIALMGTYSRFVYDTPKVALDTTLEVFPSITEQGRVRVNFKIDWSREIISDLTFELNYYISYDNQGASGEGPTRDYGFGTSLGYSY